MNWFRNLWRVRYLFARDAVDARLWSPLKETAGALHVHVITPTPGEDRTRNVMRVVQEWEVYSVVAAGAGSVKVGPGAYGGYRLLDAPGPLTLTVYDNLNAGGY